MKRYPFFLAPLFTFGAVFLATLAGGCAGKSVKLAQEKEVLPLVGSYQVKRYRLPNGLRLLVVEDHSSPTYSYQTWFNVGSRNEEVGRTGLAHLFEHMMFKGTKTVKEGEFDRMLEIAGAEGTNAFTSRDYTAYIQELPKEKLELIAKLESDRMVDLIVNEKSFKTETEVVQNERRFRKENSPDGMLYQELYEVAFTEHPYHWPVIGYQQDLDAMKAEDALRFYRSFYSPSNAIIVVSGDVDGDEVLETVHKYYGEIPGQALPDSAIEAEPAQQSPRRKTIKLNIQVEKLLMGYHTPRILHADMPALETLQAVLCGGKSSRLQRALVETGIASSVECMNSDEKDPSLFIIGVNLQNKKSALQAEKIILKELNRLSHQPVTERELTRAKNRFNFQLLQGLNSNSGRTRFLGRYETVAGDFRAALDSYRKINEVNTADVQSVVRRYFSPSNRTLITGVPKR